MIRLFGLFWVCGWVWAPLRGLLFVVWLFLLVCVCLILLLNVVWFVYNCEFLLLVLSVTCLFCFIAIWC